MNDPACVLARVRSAGGGGPAEAGRNAATAAAQAWPDVSVAVAAIGPGEVCFRSSTASFAVDPAGTRSSTVNPAPPVYVAASAVAKTPRIRSPVAVVVIGGLAKDALVPSIEVGVPSSEPDVATPEYSKIANRSVPPESVSDTVTVFAPPAMPSA